jgi:hypothetical protein
MWGDGLRGMIRDGPNGPLLLAEKPGLKAPALVSEVKRLRSKTGLLRLTMESRE